MCDSVRWGPGQRAAHRRLAAPHDAAPPTNKPDGPFRIDSTSAYLSRGAANVTAPDREEQSIWRLWASLASSATLCILSGTFSNVTLIKTDAGLFQLSSFFSRVHTRPANAVVSQTSLRHRLQMLSDEHADRPPQAARTFGLPTVRTPELGKEIHVDCTLGH